MALNSPQPNRETIKAVYDDARDARAAVQALERAGVDGVHISLDGVPESVATRNEDRRGIRHIARRVIVGAVLGALAGALIGLLAGLMYNIVTGRDALGPAVVVTTAVAAFGASAVGGIYGGIAGVSLTPGWERTFDNQHGEITLVVDSDDPDDFVRARRALPSTNPSRVHAYDDRS